MCLFFFFKQKTAYEIMPSLVGSEMCIRDRILKPEIMRTLLPEGFPADGLSQPRYEMVVEKDVFITMRDGTKVAVDVFRPDAPGEFPSLYATSPYQKDLVYLPQWPIFHFRETNDIEWFVRRGYVY